MPAGHYKSSPGDKPLAPKNGAAEFTRRAVARALQEGTRARTSGGAARRGSDDGERRRTREAPASRRSGRGGSVGIGAAPLMLATVVTSVFSVISASNIAFYSGRVPEEYTSSITGSFSLI